MSLSVDGFWKAGFWSETFWTDGFWHEGAPAQVEQSQPSGGWNAIYERYRSDEDVRRHRVALGIIPDDLPKVDAEAVKKAARLPKVLQARELRQLEREASDMALLLSLTERLADAQREAEKRAYGDLMAELAQYQSEADRFNRNQNAIAVLTMLGLL